MSTPFFFFIPKKLPDDAELSSGEFEGIMGEKKEKKKGDEG